MKIITVMGQGAINLIVSVLYSIDKIWPSIKFQFQQCQQSKLYHLKNLSLTLIYVNLAPDNYLQQQLF